MLRSALCCRSSWVQTSWKNTTQSSSRTGRRAVRSSMSSQVVTVRWASLSSAETVADAISVARIQPSTRPTAMPSHCHRGMFQSIVPWT
jgi:hypothetical protein